MTNDIQSKEAETVEQRTNSKPWLWKKGQSGNPKGRPKGKSIKEMVREFLEEHPGEMEKFVEHFVKKNRELAWQMLEGRPPEKVDMDVNLPNNLAALFIYANRRNPRLAGEDAPGSDLVDGNGASGETLGEAKGDRALLPG